MNNNPSVCCLLAIRGDGDIVYRHLSYYWNLGCRDFFILYHCAPMYDKEEVERFRIDSGANITILEDNDPSYRQDEQWDRLSLEAKAFDWHVNSDTDEILVLREHKTLQEYFAQKPNNSIVFNWFHYLNTTGEEMFCWPHRTKQPSKWTKAAMRYHPTLAWSEGHHHVIGGENYLESPDIAFYAHFKLRSYESWCNRVIDWHDSKVRRFGENHERTKKTGLYLAEPPTEEYLSKIYRAHLTELFSCDLILEPLRKELFAFSK